MPGRRAGRGQKNTIPIVAAVALNETGHPIHAKIKNHNRRLSSVQNCSALGPENLAFGSAVLIDGLAWFWFSSVTT